MQRMLPRKPPPNLTKPHMYFISFIPIEQYLSVEHVLEESGISVAPPSHHSQHLVPQVPDQGPNLQSRQHRASEVSEPEDNTEKSASPYEGIIIIIIIVSYIYTCIVDNTTTPS